MIPQPDQPEVASQTPTDPPQPENVDEPQQQVEPAASVPSTSGIQEQEESKKAIKIYHNLIND